MTRLNAKRQQALEPDRIRTCLTELQRLEFEIWEFDTTKIKIISPKGHTISFFPYSGWFTGKGINDGRGFKNLINQLNN